MKIICSSLTCEHETPVEYCKECSHANFKIRGNTTFNPNPMSGFNTRYYYKLYDEWLEKFKAVDVKDYSFE